MRHNSRLRKGLRTSLAGILALGALTALAVDAPSTRLTDAASGAKKPRRAAVDVMVPGLMIKPRALGAEKLKMSLMNQDSSELAKRANVGLKVHRPMSGGAHVLRFDRPMRSADAKAIAARLMRGGDIERVEPDYIARPLAAPTDPRYATDQWHYMTPMGANVGGANLPPVWDLGLTGVSSVVVAVLDTGIRPHEDIVDAAVLTPGYDFITNVNDRDRGRSNDGNGRDANAEDPGDFVSSDDFCFDASTPSFNQSSWHGTHVTGTIIAAMSNGLGGTGIAPGVRVLPVRVLGTCGGSFSDIIDGMRWASGISGGVLPANPTPAKIINLSLGGVPGTCGSLIQSAINDVVQRGTTVVAATGNDNIIGVAQPANCANVIAVTAHSIDGDTTNYANIGFESAISAPGGGCGEANSNAGQCSVTNSSGFRNNADVLSTVNGGTTAPTGVSSYAAYRGTSMSAPHVTGVAALMLSRNAGLVPAQMKSYLQASARPFPTTSGCVTRTLYAGRCGSGLLDAAAAVQTVDALPPYFTAITPSTFGPPGTSVALNGTAVPASGSGPVVYEWSQISPGTTPNVLSNTQDASFTIPPQGGVFIFQLKATDNANKSSTAKVTVRANSAPVIAPVGEQSVTNGQTLTFKLAATDPDGDPIAFFKVSASPETDTLVVAEDGSVSWPSAMPAGRVTLVYAVTDGEGTSEAAVIINVGSRSGGGGSFDVYSLLALALAGIALNARRLRTWLRT